MNTLTTQNTLSLILIISISISIYGVTGYFFDYPVKDSDGDEVRMGTYYVMEGSFYFAGSGSSGRLTSVIGASPCYPEDPIEVVQDTSDLGLPMKFDPITGQFNDRDLVINTSSGVTITFIPSAACNEPTSTALEMQYDASLQMSKVVVGGVIRSTVKDRGWFKLEPVVPLLPYYKLVHCTSEDKCGHIGILRDDLGSSKRRLVTGSAINDKSFYVTIIKASHNYLRIRKLPA